MSTVVSMKADGGTILVETDDSVGIPLVLLPATGGDTRGVPTGLDPVVDLASAGRKFSEVRALIVACSRELAQAISEIPTPDAVVAEFGVKFGGEAGVPMLTRLTGEATIKVSITWKPDPH